jgi:FkbM family methyltransferase
MQIVNVNFNGLHPFIIPDGDLARCCLAEIVEGRSYPFSMLSKPKVIVDIGAHVGEYTLMASLMWPGATVHAYEPCPDACEVLRENMKDRPNVVVHPCAVSGKAGKQHLHYSGFGSVCHSLNADTLPDPTGKSIEVECVGAGDIAALAPDILKVDCEGAEGDIFTEFWPEELAAIDRVHFEYHSDLLRRQICARLDLTHELAHAHILKRGLGEMTFDRK